MSNMRIWEQVDRTDPAFTKQFNRGGGFRGTATNATYLAKRATEVFGPIGTGWGLEILKEELMQGAPIGEVAGVPVYEQIHKVLVQLWYKSDTPSMLGKVHQFGQTTFVGKNKNGYFTDEEAPKKSLTDAMSKCLSLLGFAADIHLGLFDDNKYVNDLQQEFEQKHQQEAEQREERKRAEAPKVGKEQVAELDELLTATDTDRKKFFKFFKVQGLDDFTKEDFARAKRMLERKQQDKAQ